MSINTVFNTPNCINLQDLQMNAIGYARLTLDKTCKTCNPSVPIRTWTADPRISQLGLKGSLGPRIYRVEEIRDMAKKPFHGTLRKRRCHLRKGGQLYSFV